MRCQNMTKIKSIFNSLKGTIKALPQKTYNFGCKAAFVLPVSALTYFNFEKGRDIANNIQYNLLQNYEGSTNFYGKAIEHVLEKPYLSDLALIVASTALVVGSAKIANKYNPTKILINGLRNLGATFFEETSEILGDISTIIGTEEYNKKTLEETVSAE